METYFTNWTIQQPIQSSIPYFHPVNNVKQWKGTGDGEENTRNTKENLIKTPTFQPSGVGNKKTVLVEEPTPSSGESNWVQVTSSESWGNGSKLSKDNEKENVDDEDEPVEEEINESENKKVRRSFQNNIRLPETVSKGVNIEEELTKQDLYKTELCKSWIESGACRYGEKCQFAHGPDELRPVLRHPKYKTEICKTFHTYGTCPYGKRCRFVHHSPNENSPPKVEQVSGGPKEVEEQVSSGPKKEEKEEEKIEEEKIEEEKIEEEKIEEKSAGEEEPAPPVQNTKRKNGSKLPFFQKLHKRKSKF